MAKKNMYLVIDTETANSVEEPFVYDIGYCIADRKGNVKIERSFVVAEIFCDYKDLMQSAYYAEKIPQYWDDIKSGKRELKSLFNIRKQIIADIKEHNVNIIAAYNAAFDKKALNNTIRYCSKSLIRWFFPFGLEYICIWHMACQTLLNTQTYIRFAEKNGLESEKGNLLTSAEACYKYINKNVDFIESHTALEDVKIELEIMLKCFQTHKKMNPEIKRNCWQIPQKKRKELRKKREK